MTGTGNSSAPQYYQTTNGQVDMSNVNGSPVSGSNGWLWRQNQPVTFSPNGSPVTGTMASMTVDGTGGDIVYTISDYSALSLDGDIAISWAMTCANDIIQGTTTGFPVLGPPGHMGATPLPAALPLFATGLGAMGLLGWRRKRKNAAVSAVA